MSERRGDRAPRAGGLCAAASGVSCAGASASASLCGPAGRRCLRGVSVNDSTQATEVVPGAHSASHSYLSEQGGRFVPFRDGSFPLRWRSGGPLYGSFCAFVASIQLNQVIPVGMARRVFGREIPPIRSVGKSTAQRVGVATVVAAAAAAAAAAAGWWPPEGTIGMGGRCHSPLDIAISKLNRDLWSEKAAAQDDTQAGQQ